MDDIFSFLYLSSLNFFRLTAYTSFLFIIKMPIVKISIKIVLLILQCLIKQNTVLPYDSAVVLLDIHPTDLKCLST